LKKHTNFFGKNGKLLNACWNEQRRVPVLIFYILLLGIFIGQMRYYAVNVRGFADEIQQIGYVAYIAENHTVFPEFENMYQLDCDNDTSGVIEAQASTLNNYLGHPPLYYWIMQLANAVTVSGDTYIINVDRSWNRAGTLYRIQPDPGDASEDAVWNGSDLGSDDGIQLRRRYQ
jgi:hypothetical protein